MDRAKNPVGGRGTATDERSLTNNISVGQNAEESGMSNIETNGSSDQPPAESVGAHPEIEKSSNDRKDRIPELSHQQPNATKLTTSGTSSTKNGKKRLRKGKWTIEEEEYTSRIIQYFSTGLLTLPDGATLRSYLAEKLNCDPMRITKKFTGACCLGRRAYHLRDRPRASPAEIEMASFELMHLEQRFRLRVEHEQTGMPLPPRHELLASQPAPGPAMPSLFSLQQGAASIEPANHWIPNQAIAPATAQASILPGLAGVVPNGKVPATAANLGGANSQLLFAAAGQLLLQNQNERTQTNNSSTAPAPLQILNNLIASYALSQALSQQQTGVPVLQPPVPNVAPSSSATATTVATTAVPHNSPFTRNVPDLASSTSKTNQQIQSLGSQQQQQQQQQQSSPNAQNFPQSQQKEKNSAPLSRKEEHAKKLKAAFEEQQRALRMAYEKSLRDAQEQDEAPESNGKEGAQTSTASSDSTKSDPPQDMISPAEQLQRSYKAHLASLQKQHQSARNDEVGIQPGNTNGATTLGNGAPIQKKNQDEEAGVILLGFLNSLRESYEDAMDSKQALRGNPSIQPYLSNHAIGTKLEPSSAQISTTYPSEVKSKSVIHASKQRKSDDRVNTHTNIIQTSQPIASLSHFQVPKRKSTPATVTETGSSTSSHPMTEQSSSSQEDSKSDKSGQSSGDDSDKDISVSKRSSKGPPRKRLKDMNEPQEFTRENLMAHSKRMDMECGVTGDVSGGDE